ncbi:hypothetical protein [Lentzea aerocolonigenes]|uniref:hypothetical protein n=1 Tax=Lentzea aerocolonigenes TaxID=68170 RepID=UPI0004C4535D|nr:hypothetical protein [Lentzea aerocolonigenes]MCP2244187.1 hypothetical protein [Lentzea aerocolonigenes]
MNSDQRTDSALDVVSGFAGEERRARAFRGVASPTPHGCAPAYHPEADALVPVQSAADGSNTPVSKAVVIRPVRP